MSTDFVSELVGSGEPGKLASRIYKLGDALRARLVSGPVKRSPANTASIFFFGRCFKSYQAAVTLLQLGFWQDAAVLARVLREAEYQICWIANGGDDTGRLFFENHERNRRKAMRSLANHGDPAIRTQAEAIIESTPSDEFDKWWTNWWSPKRNEGIGWLAEKKLERKAYRLEYAQLSAFVHSSPALLNFYFRYAKDGLILETRPGVSEENREWANTVAFSILAAFVDACGAFTQQMAFGFEDEVTQINEWIRKQFGVNAPEEAR